MPPFLFVIPDEERSDEDRSRICVRDDDETRQALGTKDAVIPDEERSDEDPGPILAQAERWILPAAG